MAGCIVLNDAAVHDLLLKMSREEVLAFADKFKESPRDFSVGKERQYQPDPGSIVRPNGQKVLFRPFTSPTKVGTKIIVDPAPVKAQDGSQQKSPLHGILLLCDDQGLPAGLINAEEVTGFRTALSAIIPWLWRLHTKRIVVFGAGKQALWHIRLALTLRGHEIEHITLINRSRPRAQALLDQIKEELAAGRWDSRADFTILSPSNRDYDAQLVSQTSQADCIFCTVPSNEPLFSPGLVADKSPYVSAIGSWQADMIELHPGLIARGIEESQSTGVQNYENTSSGIILVDDRDSALSHAGEVVQSKLQRHQLVELGEVVELQSRKDQHASVEKLSKWLSTGLVLYKSVGVGLTDLVAGEALLELAKQRPADFQNFTL